MRTRNVHIRFGRHYMGCVFPPDGGYFRRAEVAISNVGRLTQPRTTDVPNSTAAATAERTPNSTTAAAAAATTVGLTLAARGTERQ